MNLLSRWLTTKGVMGKCPDWYEYFLAADRCHAKPWEIAQQARFWKEKALIALQAEAHARKTLEGN
jgi:hypothetical protein